MNWAGSSRTDSKIKYAGIDVRNVMMNSTPKIRACLWSSAIYHPSSVVSLAVQPGYSNRDSSRMRDALFTALNQVVDRLFEHQVCPERCFRRRQAAGQVTEEAFQSAGGAEEVQ